MLQNPKEFIYLNAASINSPGYTGNPYDLEIVPHGSVDKDDFYTMSALGVTHFHKGNAEFTPLDQWEREYFLYNQISNLAVFKNFRKWKVRVLTRGEGRESGIGHLQQLTRHVMGPPRLSRR